jgi:uncharacterized phosphatase
MLNIYLVRHGQNKDNEAGILNGHRDEPLTNLGIEQAKDLAEFVKEHNITFTKVYSSPLVRAYDTAKEITKTLSLPDPEILPLLIERDFGEMTGKNIIDIKKYCAPKILETPAVTYFLEVEGAETFPDLIIRAKKLLKLITEKHISGNILLVGHGDFGKMIYAAYYNLPWEDVLKSFHFGNSELLLLASGAPLEKSRIFKTAQFNS